MFLLAFAQAQKHLCPAFFEIHFKRHQGQAFLKGQGGETLDLAAVHEQFSRTLGLMIELVGLGVFGNVAADEPDFVVFYPSVGLFERDVAFAQTLHLAADQRQAALQGIDDQEILVGLAILGD